MITEEQKEIISNNGMTKQEVFNGMQPFYSIIDDMVIITDITLKNITLLINRLESFCSNFNNNHCNKLLAKNIELNIEPDVDDICTACKLYPVCQNNPNINGIHHDVCLVWDLMKNITLGKEELNANNIQKIKEYRDIIIQYKDSGVNDIKNVVENWNKV